MKKTDAMLASTSLKKQSNGERFINIRFKGSSNAIVFDESTKEAFTFSVHQLWEKSIILVHFKFTRVEVITIDPQSGSFVLTEVFNDDLWNLTKVWTGQCKES